MTRVQVTVRGGGILGLSIAYALVRRGAAVRLIEELAIGAGSSGGLVGALTPHVPENWGMKKAFQLESLLMAQTFWDGVQAASGLKTGYARLGRLQPILNAAGLELARKRSQTAQSLWQGNAIWQVRPSMQGPWQPACPSSFLIHDTLSARLHPRLACAALVRAITALGGEVIVGPAQDQGAVIWATGVAGLAALGQDLGRSMGGGVKGQAALLQPQDDFSHMPQIFADALHIVPHEDGTVAIGSTSENQWSDASSTDEKLDALIAKAGQILPALQGAVVLDRWAGLRPRATTRAPILGAWPGRPGHFVANGGFKIGFGMAPKIAQVMADLVLTGRGDIPLEFGVPQPV